MASSVTPLDVGLLLLRVYAGGAMLVGHGWGKLLGFSERSGTFPDPLGVGSPASLALAVGAEVGCSLLLIVGAFTRFAAVPLAFTMGVAGVLVHGADPWAKKELAFTFLAIFLALVATGPGRLSVDAVLRGKR